MATIADKPEIVLIHGNTFFRDCFARCLEESYGTHRVLACASVSEWKEAASDGREAAAIILFLDDDGSSAGVDLQAFESTSRGTAIIVMSDSESMDWALRVIQGGARGFIPTSLPLSIVVEALRFVLAGGTYVPIVSIGPNVDKGFASRPSSLFTARQAMIVKALCRGLANKQIAYQLNMSEHTVKVHLRHIMRRLNVKNRTEAAVRAQEMLGKHVSAQEADE